jgi:adenylate cyclase
MPIPIECERRFLVSGDGWLPLVRRTRIIRQGYMSTGDDVTVRVRLTGDTAFLTIKVAMRGPERHELEYPIPVEHAAFLLDTACGAMVVDKTRHEVALDGHVWEVDVFAGLNGGLVLAEVELDRPDQPLALPPWLGTEITGIGRYDNSQLARHPFSRWDAALRL